MSSTAKLFFLGLGAAAVAYGLYQLLDESSYVIHFERFPGNEHIHHLTDMDVENFIAGNDKVLLVFFAPWCNHSQQFMPDLCIIAKRFARERRRMKFAVVNCSTYPSVKTTFNIGHYPTIKYYCNGHYIGDWNQFRTERSLYGFCTNPPSNAEDMLARYSNLFQIDSMSSIHQ